MILVLGFLLVAVGAVAATAFLLIYGLTVPWYRYGIGRAMFAKSVSNNLLGHLVLWYWTFGEHIRHPAALLVVFSVWSPAQVFMLVELLRAKRNGGVLA